jgi:allantoin racemase
MRIWHQSMAPLGEFGQYAALLDDHMRQMASAGTIVTVHGAAPGSYLGRPPAEILKYPYAKHLIQSQAIENCLKAEREGYDAVAFATFGDPYLTECRSVVGIPVSSMVESSLLVGCSMAGQMALVTLSPGNVQRVHDLVRRHGLSSRVSSVVALEPRVTESDLVGLLDQGNANELVSNFTTVAQRAVHTGADLIIPAEGALNEVLFRNGCHHVGDVAVMDILAVLLGYSELLVQLQGRSGLTVGRRWTYPRPSAELIRDLRAAVGLSQEGHDGFSKP